MLNLHRYIEDSNGDGLPDLTDDGEPMNIFSFDGDNSNTGESTDDKDFPPMPARGLVGYYTLLHHVLCCACVKKHIQVMKAQPVCWSM
jgi:hypothetical protein